MTDLRVPFSRPSHSSADLDALARVLASGRLEGDGRETHACHARLEAITGARRALLTTSGTAALEMACLLLDLKPGDEVVLPSFTFSSSANAVALRGAVPVFVDVRPDTLNLDETRLEAAIGARTRAIMPVHYAGVACDMAAIGAVAADHGLAVIEDAAQAVCATYRNRPLGGIGTFGALSFHVSKNVSCGEGGALLINDPAYAERAEILWEKGTNRARFLRGEIDKYTWEDVGSSFLPSEILAALLASQLERADAITAARRALWDRYHAALAELEEEGRLRRPQVPPECGHNAHIYHVLLADEAERTRVMTALKGLGIATQFHYVPLHASPAGRRLGRTAGPMAVVEDVSARLLRLPLFPDMTEDQQALVIGQITRLLGQAPRGVP